MWRWLTRRFVTLAVACVDDRECRGPIGYAIEMPAPNTQLIEVTAIIPVY